MNSTQPLQQTIDDQDDGIQVTLGLRREPFAPQPDKDFFYSEPTRAQRLKLLHHLAPYGEVLVVTGEAGSGKTALLQQFVERAHDSWRVCVITAHSQLGRGQLLDALMEGFAIPAKRPDTEQEKLEVVKNYCVSLKRNNLLPVAVIDDAHKLSRPALGVLLQLLQSLDDQEKPLRIVLFAAPQLRDATSAPDLHALQERITHTFNLPPLSEKETANYIAHRLGVAGMSGKDLFTETVIKMIHRTSQGLPGKINELARVVVANNATGGKSVENMPAFKASRKPGQQRNTIPLSIALAILVLLGIYYMNKTSPPKGVGVEDRIARNGTQQAVPLPLPGGSTVAGATAESAPPSPMPVQEQAPAGATAAAPAPGPDDTTAAQPPQAPAATGPSLPAPPALASQAPAASAANGGGNNTPAPSPAAMTGSAPVASAAPQTVPQVKAPAGPAAAATPAGSAPATGGEHAGALVAKVEPAPAPAAAGAVKAPAGGVKNADWLLTQAPGHFTLQLMAVKQAASIDRFLHRPGLNARDFARFQTLSRGQTWNVLVYGQFATRDAAAAGATALPAALHNVKPWIRSNGDVQAAIKVFRETATP